jgi:hypothetical protein
MVLRQPKAHYIHKRYTAIDTSLYSGILPVFGHFAAKYLDRNVKIYRPNRSLFTKPTVAAGSFLLPVWLSCSVSCAEDLDAA